MGQARQTNSVGQHEVVDTIGLVKPVSPLQFGDGQRGQLQIKGDSLVPEKRLNIGDTVGFVVYHQIALSLHVGETRVVAKALG